MSGVRSPQILSLVRRVCVSSLLLSHRCKDSEEKKVLILHTNREAGVRLKPLLSRSLSFAHSHAHTHAQTQSYSVLDVSREPAAGV